MTPTLRLSRALGLLLLAGVLTVTALSTVHTVDVTLETTAATPSPCARDHTTKGCKRVKFVLGHRCRHWPNARTNENTVASVRWVAEHAPGAGCEIDVWRLRDGSTIVHHDNTWGRVTDPATRPAGLPRMVKDATLAQVRQMRTNGGEPIPTLAEMIDAAGQYGVRLLIESKNFTPGAEWHQRAVDAGARVWWYQRPNADRDCQIGMLQSVAAAGARVGIKGYGTCPMTPRKAAQRGTLYVTAGGSLTRAQVTRFRERGVLVGPYSSAPAQYEALAGKQVPILITSNPRPALRYLGRL